MGEDTLFLTGYLSAFFTCIAVLVGFLVFEIQGCPSTYFQDGNICLDCHIYLGENCNACVSRTNCTDVPEGFIFFQEDNTDLGILVAD